MLRDNREKIGKVTVRRTRVSSAVPYIRAALPHGRREQALRPTTEGYASHKERWNGKVRGCRKRHLLQIGWSLCSRDTIPQSPWRRQLLFPKGALRYVGHACRAPYPTVRAALPHGRREQAPALQQRDMLRTKKDGTERLWDVASVISYKSVGRYAPLIQFLSRLDGDSSFSQKEPYGSSDTRVMAPTPTRKAAQTCRLLLCLFGF